MVNIAWVVDYSTYTSELFTDMHVTAIRVTPAVLLVCWDSIQ